MKYPSKCVIIPSESALGRDQYKLPFRFWVSLGVTLIFLILLVPVGYILIKFLQPKVTVSNKTQIVMPDGSLYGMAKLTLIDKDLFEDNLKYDLFISYPAEEAKGRRLQQSTSSDYFLHTNDQQAGITVRMSSQGNTTIYVNEKTFVDFVSKKSPTASAKSNEKKLSSQEYLRGLGQVFTKAFESSTGTKNVAVKFTNTTMVNIKIDPTFKYMELDISSATATRSLMEDNERNLQFLSSLASVANSIVPKIASFFINTVRKYGPLIGKVAGGIIGYYKDRTVEGGQAGLKFGEKIGSAASELVKNCIQQDTLKIICSPESIAAILTRYGAIEFIKGLKLDKVRGGNLVKVLLSAIPKNAQSSFGEGSLTT